MLKKLLKYDLKDACKGVIVFYALAIKFSCRASSAQSRRAGGR